MARHRPKGRNVHRPAPMAATRTATTLLVAVIASTAVLAGGCAHIPKGRYGVDELQFEGVKQLDERSLAACLATHQRESLNINIGRNWEPACGQPPFDGSRIHVQLWRWPWTTWPLYDRALFERDVERVERWYKARGYYDAHVLSVQFDPPAAADSDRVPKPKKGKPPVCKGATKGKGCKVDITVSVEEGKPVIVKKVTVQGIDDLPPDLRRHIRDAVQLHVGDHWDEAFYEQSKSSIGNELREASFACAKVTGSVQIDPTKRTATVDLDVEPGPPAQFGQITVQGQQKLPVKPIKGAALLRPGDRYSESALDDAQRAIYNLGAFSSVRINPQVSAQTCPNLAQPSGEGGGAEGAASGGVAVAGPKSPPVRIPVVISVTPGRTVRFGIGAGLQSGTVQQANETVDVRQWDVHLLAVFEHRNLFGGLRRLRIEDRPRILFQDVFPRTTTPALGNVATAEFRQPAFLEPRTSLVAGTRWDLGPEPFGGRFTRHDIDAHIGLERGFLDGRVFLSGGFHENIFIVTSVKIPYGEQGTRNYHVTFLEQYANLDLRDDPRDPHRGAFFSIGLQEAGFWLPSSWNYVRITPEARAYVPLPLNIVLAFRFALGAMFITHADPKLTLTAQRLGPEQYRLRGGGASSNRGFIPGDLGDGIEGGLRRWESSIELRIPLTESFGIALFADAGDVSRGTTFRFDHLNLSVGGGLRYKTVVGPLRLDIGYRVPHAQILGQPDPQPRYVVNLGFTRFAGAVHLTIGQSF